MCDCDFCKTMRLFAENISDDKRQALYDLLDYIQSDIFDILAQGCKPTEHMKKVYHLIEDLMTYFVSPFARKSDAFFEKIFSTDNQS